MEVVLKEILFWGLGFFGGYTLIPKIQSYEVRIIVLLRGIIVNY